MNTPLLKYGAQFIFFVSFFLWGCNEPGTIAQGKTASFARKKYNCMLDKISTGDTLKIFHEYEGCFDSGKEISRIFYRGEILSGTHQRLADYRGGDPMKSCILSDSSILLFKLFEEKARAYTDTMSFCTTTSTYRVQIGRDSFSFTDGNCNFEYYYTFIEKSFKRE